MRKCPIGGQSCQSAFNGNPLSASEYDPPPGGWDRWGGVRDPLLLSEVETTAQPDLFYADHPRLPFHRCTTKRSFCNQTRWVKLDADFPPSGSSLQAFPQTESALDLTAGALADDHETWTSPTDYAACQGLGGLRVKLTLKSFAFNLSAILTRAQIWPC